MPQIGLTGRTFNLTWGGGVGGAVVYIGGVIIVLIFSVMSPAFFHVGNANARLYRAEGVNKKNCPLPSLTAATRQKIR